MSKSKSDFRWLSQEERNTINSHVQGHAGAIDHLKERCHTALVKVGNSVYLVLDCIDDSLGILQVQNPAIYKDAKWKAHEKGEFSCGLFLIPEVLEFMEAMKPEFREKDQETKKAFALLGMSATALLASVLADMEDPILQLLESLMSNDGNSPSGSSSDELLQ